MLIILTGCYDASSIENSYYIVAMGIDLAENNLYSLSIQIAKNESNKSSSSAGESSQSSSSTIYNVKCSTIDSGLSIIDNYLNKKINLSHCSAIIFSEELAYKGIKEIIMNLADNPEIRPNSYLLISNKKAIDVLDKVSNSGENFSSRFYEYIINSSEYTGYTSEATIGQFITDINNISSNGIAIYSIVDDSTVQNDGIAIFKDDYMVGHVSALDSISHLLLTNDFEKATITITNPLDNSSKIDLSIRTKRHPKKYVNIINNTPFINCELSVNAYIISSKEKYNFAKNENIKILENAVSNYIENIVLNYLYTLSKDYKADILDFKNILSKSCYTNQDLEKYHWEEIYKNSYFNVTVNSTVNAAN